MRATPAQAFMHPTSTTLPSLERTRATTTGASDRVDAPATAATSNAVRHAAAGLQIDIVTSRDALDAIGPEWNELFERAGQPHHVFQTYGFAQLWSRSYLAHNDLASAGERDTCTCSLAIVTARRNGRLVLVWPMVRQKQMGLTVLGWLGEPVAQYGDVLADPGEPVEPMLRRAWKHAVAALHPDLLRLRKVRADATIAPFLSEALTRTSEPVEAPCITLAAGGSAFQDRQSSKAKKNRRRLMRRLEETGKVEFRVHDAGEAASAVVTAGLAAKRDWLVRRALMSRALADHKIDSFFRAAVAPDLGASSALVTKTRVFSLHLDDRPVAIAIGFACKRRLMLHLITQTSDVERFGAGVLNLEAILQQAETEGFEAVDLLPPKAEYKLDWADTQASACDHVLGLTYAGKLWARSYDGFARPQLKRAIEGLPESVRRRLAARTLMARA